MNIVEFLEARIAEDDAVARKATPREWFDVVLGRIYGEAADEDAYPPEVTGHVSRPDADHIARWDPARVLAECAAKRAIVDDLFSYEAEIDYERGCYHTARQIRAGECDGIKPEQINGVQILAAVYDQHPDYDRAWRVGS